MFYLEVIGACIITMALCFIDAPRDVDKPGDHGDNAQ